MDKTKVASASGPVPEDILRRLGIRVRKDRDGATSETLQRDASAKRQRRLERNQRNRRPAIPTSS